MSENSDERLKASFYHLGLDDITRIIYLWLLENGPAKARKLSIEINQPKTTVLEKLYVLEDLGLTRKNKIKNSFEFSAESPKQITSLLSRKEKELEYTRNKSMSEINELEKKISPASLPAVEFYEGKENIKKLYLKSLKSRTDIYSLGDLDAEARYLGNFAHDYWTLRSTARIKSLALTSKSAKNTDFSRQNDVKHMRETYFYEPVEGLNTIFYLFDSTFGIISPAEDTAVSIDNPAIANAFRSLLQLVRVAKL